MIVVNANGGEQPTGGAARVPVDALEMLEATWIRCRMAGMRLAQEEKLARWFGWAATGLSSVTSLGVFATMQLQDDVWSRGVVGVVTAAAAVLAALQTKATKDAQAEAKRSQGILQTFHPLHEDLLAAIAAGVRDGTPVDPALLARAREARDHHAADMGSEQPTYDRAARSVARTMRSLGLHAD